MSEAVLNIEISQLITEDDEPVDNFLTEKQERLLTEPLYSCWKAPENRPFLAAANVGVFNSVRLPAIVPDVFLSLDVEINPEWWENQHRSYFVWEFGKAPDIVIEIVSNKIGEEDSKKFTRYAQMGVTYYIIFDPYKKLSDKLLSIYTLSTGRYVLVEDTIFSDIGLGVTLWSGEFENTSSSSWLRWTDLEGNLIPTGIEKASIQGLRADEEKLRADAQTKLACEEKLRADTQTKLAYEEKLRADAQTKLAYEEKLRADRLAAKLKELGLDPNSLI
jgi:Uma2 family endonuclease